MIVYIRIVCCFVLLVFVQTGATLSSLNTSEVASSDYGNTHASVDQKPAFLYDFIPTTSISTLGQEHLPTTRSRFTNGSLQSILDASIRPNASIKTYLPGGACILPGLKPVNISYPFQDFV